MLDGDVEDRSPGPELRQAPQEEIPERDRAHLVAHERPSYSESSRLSKENDCRGQGKREQVASFGDLRRRQLVDRMRWLDGELMGREFIGADRYNIADITAQVALLTARGALKLSIPEDHRQLTRWWNAVSSRPSARA